MVSAKIIDVGSSSGVILNKEVLSQLGVKKGDTVFFTPSATGGLTITPYNPEFAEQMKIGEKIMQRDRGLLRALAQPATA